MWRAPDVPVLPTAVATFVLSYILTIPPAGPIAALVASDVLHGRTRRALEIVAGSFLPFVLWGTASWYGVTGAGLHELGGLEQAGRVLEAGILLVVGAMLWRGRLGEREDTSTHGGVLVGLVAAGANPGIFVTSGTVAAVMLGRGAPVAQAAMAPVFGLAFGLGVVCWQLTMVWLLDRFRDRAPVAHLRRVMRGFAVFLWLVAAVVVLAPHR